MPNINAIHRYRVEPTWLLHNLAIWPGGKGPLRLCWGRGLTHWVVNTDTRRYRLLSTWDHILTDEGAIPNHAMLRCKRNGVKGKLTIHYTTESGEDKQLKVDEDLRVDGLKGERDRMERDHRAMNGARWNRMEWPPVFDTMNGRNMRG